MSKPNPRAQVCTPPERWTVDECPDADGFRTVRHYDGGANGDTERECIATVFDEQRARLIASAPDILTALRSQTEALAALARWHDDADYRMELQLRANAATDGNIDPYEVLLDAARASLAAAREVLS